MSALSVVDAAEELGVSPRRVRQMIVDGVLSAERVGRAWVIDDEQLRQVERSRREVGRPWGPRSAWSVLALAGGEEPDVSPVERSRAKKRLAQGLGIVVGRLGARAEQQRFYAHPGVLDRLAEASEVVRTGISAAAEHGADLMAGDGFEGYLRSSDFDEFVSRFGLDDQAARPNVSLRIVSDVVWPFRPGEGSAGRAIIAVDLLGSDDPRARRAGAELLEHQ